MGFNDVILRCRPFPTGDIMHTFVFAAEVISTNAVAAFLAEYDASLTWNIEVAGSPQSRFNPRDALMGRVSDLFLRDKIDIVGDLEEFTLGDPIKVAPGIYEFWFTWYMIDGDKKPDPIDMHQNKEDSEQRLYIAGVNRDEELAKRIRDEIRRAHQSLDIEDGNIHPEEPWSGLFKIILTMKKHN